MKIYTNKINESWIIDRVIHEWTSNNNEIISNSIQDADIVWIISTWTWKKIRPKYLKNKKVVASIYHIDFDNFNKFNHRTRPTVSQNKRLCSLTLGFLMYKRYFLSINKGRKLG